MSEIPTREEVERLAVVIECAAVGLEHNDLWRDIGGSLQASATALRSLSSRVEELEAREHAAWKLGYASGIGAAKKGDAPCT